MGYLIFSLTTIKDSKFLFRRRIFTEYSFLVDIDSLSKQNYYPVSTGVGIWFGQ